MRMLTLILLSSVVAHGADKPVCDANAVTRSCKFFEERKDQQKIKIQDGSFIPNPMFQSPAYKSSTNPYPPSGSSGGFGAMTPEQIEAAQANQADILDQMAKGPFSTRFKISFANTAGFLAANPTTPVNMPWPPDAKTPQMMPVTGQQVFAYAKNKMNDTDYVKLMKFVDIQKAPQVEAALALQKLQQEQLAQIQKQAEEDRAEAQRLGNRKTKIRELFKYTQEQMIALIQQGKKEADLTPEQQKQITKIKMIKLHDLDDPDVPSSTTCVASNQNNAYYTYLNHEVTFCPGYFNKSDAEIVSTLAHEMGHSIDACYSQMPLWSVNAEKLSLFLERKDLTESDRETAEIISPRSGAKIINMDLKNTFSSSETVDKLIQAGVFKEEVSATPYKKFPQLKEFQCLSSNSRFRINNPSDIVATKRSINRGISELPVEERQGQDKAAERYGKALDAYPQCYGTLKGSSQAQEISSDLFGALILEKYFMDHPPKSEEEKVASVASWVTSTCNENGLIPEVAVPQDQITPEMYSYYLSSQMRLRKHPESITRLKQIYLNLPGMANLFDCKRQTKSCFDHLSFYNRAGGASKSSPEGNPQKGVR